MRRTALQCVLEMARADDRVCFIGSDLGAGVMDAFGCEMPQRLFREGVSEAAWSWAWRAVWPLKVKLSI